MRNILSSPLNLSTMFCLAAIEVEPSILLYVMLRARTRLSIMLRAIFVCEKMRTLCPCFFHRGRIWSRIWNFPLLSTSLLTTCSSLSSSPTNLSSPSSPSSSSSSSSSSSYLINPIPLHLTNSVAALSPGGQIRSGWLQSFLSTPIALKHLALPSTASSTSLLLKYPSYSVLCLLLSLQKSTCSVLPGIRPTSFMSFFCLLRRYGLMRSFNTSAHL
mmetsp:Transcript_4637/g.9323  ORF Transcript_4637/g.9323 Transcript_4637/m.9323 type:complete len:216 (-) Transcript_4637:793-1440(-)